MQSQSKPAAHSHGQPTSPAQPAQPPAQPSAPKPDYRSMILADLTALAEKYAAADGINPRYIAVFETLLSLARLFLH